jgi:hypothetical protein
MVTRRQAERAHARGAAADAQMEQLLSASSSSSSRLKIRLRHFPNLRTHLKPPRALQISLQPHSGERIKRPRPSSALLLLMAALDSMLHLLWLLTGLLHNA